MKRCSPADIEEVTRIMTHESVFDLVSDDGVAGKENFEKYVTAQLHSVAVYTLMPGPGMIIIYSPINYVTYDIHIAAVKGETGREFALKNTLDTALWMADNTPIEKYMVTVPTLYPNVANFCKALQLVKEGHLTKAYLKDGTLYDIEIYGIQRPDVLKQRR
jgi:hypothetical protein